MLMDIVVVIPFILLGLLHSSSQDPQELSLLESLTRLLSNRPSHLPWIPSIAYETKPKNEYQQRQFIKDRLYERQVELILAELQACLVGKTKAQEFFKEATVYGLPSSDNLKFYENFILSYDNRMKQPVWSLEHLTKKHFRGKTAMRGPRKNRFFPDMALHEYFRTGYPDYKNNFYDRGQFAPACDNRIKRQFLERSYHYSNTAPQTRNINRKGCLWDRLESYVAFLAWRSRNVYAVTGALYKPYNDRKHLRYGVIGPNRLAVPTHFYKIILYEDRFGDLLMEAYAVPNSMHVGTYEELERFRIDIDQLDKIEGLTGLKFFDLLDRSGVLKPIRFQSGFREIFGEA